MIPKPGKGERYRTTGGAPFLRHAPIMTGRAPAAERPQELALHPPDQFAQHLPATHDLDPRYRGRSQQLTQRP